MRRSVVLVICLLLVMLSLRPGFAEKAAPDFTLTDIDGIEFSLRSYRRRVVLLDFFATWCGPCRDEISVLKSLHKEFSSDLVIASISVDPSFDTVEKLRVFRQQYNISWVLVRDTAGVARNYSDAQVSGVPTLVIIDQRGYLRYVHVGFTDELRLSEEISYLTSRSLVGDLNNDGKIDILDVSFVARTYGSRSGDERWNEATDLNNDGLISILDIATVTKEYGEEVKPFNFLVNPSVEIDRNGDSSPEFWEKIGYNDVSPVYAWLNMGHEGNRSVKVSITRNASAIGWHQAGWTQSFHIHDSTVEVGSEYFLRFWYESDIKCYVYVGFWDAAGNSSLQLSECAPAAAWSMSQGLAFQIPAETYLMSVGILIRNRDITEAGTTAFAIADDFELIQK